MPSVSCLCFLRGAQLSRPAERSTISSQPWLASLRGIFLPSRLPCAQGRLAWAPPQATGAGSYDGTWDAPSAPAPTAAWSHPELAGMELFRRDETMGVDTCGYVSGQTDVLVCKSSSTCMNSKSYLGCCGSLENDSCTTAFVRTCLNAKDTGTSDCDNHRTTCCTEDSAKTCVTWELLTEASPSDIYTFFSCASTGGTSTLVWTLPASSSSSSSSPTTTTSSSSSSLDISSLMASKTTSAASPTSTSKPNTQSHLGVGAIVGIAVGGMALVLILIGLAQRIVASRLKRDGDATSAAAFVAGGGSGGGAYSRLASSTDAMKHHLLSSDDTGAGGGDPTSTPPTGGPAWGLQQGHEYYGMGGLPHQPPTAVAAAAAAASYYDPGAAAAGAAVPSSYMPQVRPTSELGTTGH